MDLRYLILPLSLGILLFPGSARPGDSPEATILKASWLIDGTGAPALDDAWVRIEGNRVVDVGSGEPAAVPGAEVIDLEGRTILPGLADMHVHLGELEQARWMLKLLLAHGVTNVKETGNRLGNLAAIRRWMEGERDLPRLFVSGVTLNGDAGALRFLQEGERTEALLRDNLAFGVEFIKIHNWISSKALEQIVQFAKDHDIYLTGHVPLGMTSVAAVEAGMKILEHVRLRPGEVLEDPEAIATFPLDLVVMRRTAFWAHVDPDGEGVRRTLEAWKRRDFFIDPTLVVHEALAHADREAVTEAPELSLVSPATLKRWRDTRDRYGDLSPAEFDRAKRAVEGMTAFVGRAHANGIKVLTGTDTAVHWVVPGVSLHRELELLVEGGLSPEQAIHSSTGLAAEALRTPDRGTVAPGKVADLVIVRGDVGRQIGAVRRVERIVVDGRLLDAGALREEAARWAAEHQPEAEEDA